MNHGHNLDHPGRGIPAAIFGLFFGAPLLIQCGVIGYVGALVFQFLNLPLEFDASKRALAELDWPRLHPDYLKNA